MRLVILACAIAFSSPANGQTTGSACLTIGQLDSVHGVQMRLSRSPNTILFPSDIRLLREQMGTLSERVTLEAVGSTSLSRQGNTFLRFLRNTQQLLRGISMDDPSSALPHFTPAVRSNLSAIATYLGPLRCTNEALEAAQQNSAMSASLESTGPEDDAAEIIRQTVEEILDLRNLGVFTVIVVLAIGGTKLGRKIILRQKRRAKRHSARIEVQYEQLDQSKPGRLIDINCFGTKLKHTEDEPMQLGSKVKILIEAEWISGVVVWTNAHYAGIQFNRSVSLLTVAQVCDLPAPKKQNGAPLGAA